MKFYSKKFLRTLSLVSLGFCSSQSVWAGKFVINIHNNTDGAVECVLSMPASHGGQRAAWGDIAPHVTSNPFYKHYDISHICGNIGCNVQCSTSNVEVISPEDTQNSLNYTLSMNAEGVYQLAKTGS